ncbi:MAG: AAA family ATPase [Bryobacterales bacterium]|nr:AAA family ATPase [Bryobacterales bacterium]MBV9398421.1 AAA family ATPase [Bryobacterales bacterium]
MYNAFFGFTASPFSLSPDPSFLYRSQQHEEALANLIYGVQARKGFMVLCGEVGTGKTTMLECLRDYLDAQYIDFAFLFNSRIDSKQFFEMIAYDLDLRCERSSKTEVLFALNQLLMQQAQEKRTVVLIVDEAHNLEWEVLEEIRLLGNLETRNGKLLQVVLAGQPELDRKLEAPNMRQLKQRIVLRCNLDPFTARDTTDYIQFRLACAGVEKHTVFPENLLAEIHLRSRGIPRLINAICDNLLLTAFAMERKSCDLEMLDEVSRDMRLEWPGSRHMRRALVEDTFEQIPFKVS